MIKMEVIDKIEYARSGKVHYVYYGARKYSQYDHGAGREDFTGNPGRGRGFLSFAHHVHILSPRISPQKASSSQPLLSQMPCQGLSKG